VTTKKRSSDFFRKKTGATPSVAAAGDTNPSDATADAITQCHSVAENNIAYKDTNSIDAQIRQSPIIGRPTVSAA